MSSFFSSFHFIRPIALLLIPVVLGLWWVWKRRSDPLHGWRNQIEPELLEALVVGRDSLRKGSGLALPAAWLLAAVAIAGPTWKPEPSPFADDATPLMILLKCDTSMDAPEPAPSRLERAKLKVDDLAETRRGQPLGLIAYAGSAHLVLPPTRDTAVVAEMAGEISTSIMPVTGDRLDLALRLAGRVLSEGGQGGSIVVLADSVDTAVSQWPASTPFPVQFLALNRPGSTQDSTLRRAAKDLNASVQPFSVDDEDVTAIVRRAARTPVTQSGGTGERWEESGYWLLPLIALVVALSFRRDGGEVAS